MPTVMTHALVPLAAAVALGRVRIAPRIAVAGMVLAMLPDADVIGFRLGITYGDALGHRGASHAVFSAILIAVLAAALLRVRDTLQIGFLMFAMASHGLLDTLTNGGLGAALLWPFSDMRIHAPWTPIRVSPIGRAFLSPRGLIVLASEAQWVALPCMVFAGLGWWTRKLAKR